MPVEESWAGRLILIRLVGTVKDEVCKPKDRKGVVRDHGLQDSLAMEKFSATLFVLRVDLAGVDALSLTVDEVAETSEDTTGVLIQPEAATPAARLIVKSVGKPGYQRSLTFSDYAKVTVKDAGGNVLTPKPPDQAIKITGASDQDVTLTVTQATTTTWSLDDSVMATLTVKRGNEVIGTDKVKLVPVRVTIDALDPHFAPSVDTLDVEYTIDPPSFAAQYARIEVFKKGDVNTPIYKDETIPNTAAPPSGSPLYTRTGSGSRSRVILKTKTPTAYGST